MLCRMEKYNNPPINIKMILILIIILSYDHLVLNGLEKIFAQTYFNNNSIIIRPNNKCTGNKNVAVGCIGTI